MEIVMVLVVIGLLVAIIVPKLNSVRFEAQDVYARKTLEGIGAAMEAYRKDYGVYPTSMMDMIAAVPPYITRDVCGTTESGYSYECSMAVDAYTISAVSVPIGERTSWTMLEGMDILEYGP